MSAVDRMRAGYEAYSRRDPAMPDEHFTDDIEWSVPGPQGTLRGRDAVKGFFAWLAEEFASHTIELDRAIESGDQLWCRVTHVFTTHEGAVHRVAAVHLWTLQGDRLAALDEVADTMGFALASGAIPAGALPVA